MDTWKVCPIQGPQLLDVRVEDLIQGGHFRVCDTYRGGGGYDKFPAICKRKLGLEGRLQFIVQLYGCHLRCPYCYVTEAGYLGRWISYTSDELIKAYKQTPAQVFHLSELYKKYQSDADVLLEDSFSIDLIQYDALTNLDVSAFK